MNKEKNVTGSRIRDIRTSLGLTGEEFGKKLNVTKTAVSYWESGTRKPDSDIINKLADLGNVSTDWLLGRTDERKAILCEYDIDGKNVIMAVSKDVYPNGLTKEEVIEKLKIIKRMEDMGIQFPTSPTEQD